MPTTPKTGLSLNEGEMNRNKKNKDKLTRLRKEEQAENRTKILQFLYSAGPNGMSQNDLIKKAEISDTAIQNHLKDLIKEGLITRKKHKQDHYRLTTEAAKSVELQSWLFGEEALRELRDGFSKFMNNMDSRIKAKLVPMDSKLMSQTFETPLTPEEYSDSFNQEHETMNKISYSLSKTEEEIFKFAMDVGILVTYVMLEAIKPQSNNNKTGKQREYDTLIWTRNTVRLNNILFHFVMSDTVRQKNMLRESVVKKRIESMSERANHIRKQEILDRSIPDEIYSQYEVDEKTYRNLIDAYRKIWPASYLGLEYTKNVIYRKTLDVLKTVNSDDNFVTGRHFELIKENRDKKNKKR